MLALPPIQQPRCLLFLSLNTCKYSAMGERRTMERVELAMLRLESAVKDRQEKRMYGIAEDGGVLE